MKHRMQWLLAVIAFATAVVPQLSAQSAAMRARIEATVAAFNGTPDDYEKYAQEAFTKALLDRGTSERRKAFAQRVRGDFGTIEATELRRADPKTVVIRVEGTTGARGTLTIEHEPAEPHKLTDLRFILGDGDRGEAASLPPLRVNGSMSANELSSALDTYVAKLAADGVFAGGVLVARDGKPLLEKAYGLANRADNVPNTARTRFNLGSINKHFTRVAIGQLAAAGKIATSDTIGKVLPDYPNANAHKATVEQLLDHRGGLADFFSAEFDQASKARFRSNRDFYRFVAPKPLVFEPGTRKEYCNSCFIVLAEMVERLSGMPYEKYVEQNVFGRAGMKESGFFATDAVNPNVAIGYTKHGEETRSNVLLRGAAGNGAGGAYATLRDLLTFDGALRDGKLLDAQWTAWFYGMPAPANGRVTKFTGYAGGSQGVNAIVSSDGTWSVIVLGNIDGPVPETLGTNIYRAITSK